MPLSNFWVLLKQKKVNLSKFFSLVHFWDFKKKKKKNGVVNQKMMPPTGGDPPGTT
ncbi:MAG: hypothetical protein ACFFDT_28810 [Candidatus Hodarchaeota archaeon]